MFNITKIECHINNHSLFFLNYIIQVPQQPNMVDCGVYLMKFAEMLITVNQNDFVQYLCTFKKFIGLA